MDKLREDIRHKFKTTKGNEYDAIFGIKGDRLKIDFAPVYGYFMGDEYTGYNEVIEILNNISNYVKNNIDLNNINFIIIDAADEKRQNIFTNYLYRFLKQENINHIKIIRQLDELRRYIRKIIKEEYINNCPKINTTQEIIDEINKYNTSEELLRAGGISLEALDRAAFGFAENDIKTLMPNQLNIKWKDDYKQAKWEQKIYKEQGLSKEGWAKKINLSDPIDVIYENDKFWVDDGHHRYYAAKILNLPLKVNLEIKQNPIVKLAPDLSYDDFHRCVFNQVKKNLQESSAKKLIKETFDDLNKYKEIEFVCYNSDNADSTNKEQQKKLYQDLKKLQVDSDYGIMPYMQDFSDDTHKELSLAVVITDKTNEKQIEKQIFDLAKKHNIKFDLYNERNDKEVDSLIRGDLYDNLLKEEYENNNLDTVFKQTINFLKSEKIVSEIFGIGSYFFPKEDEEPNDVDIVVKLNVPFEDPSVFEFSDKLEDIKERFINAEGEKLLNVFIVDSKDRKLNSVDLWFVNHQKEDLYKNIKERKNQIYWNQIKKIIQY